MSRHTAKAVHEQVAKRIANAARICRLDLNPLSFREFLLAIGEEGLARLIDEVNIPLIENFREKYKFKKEQT